MSWPKPTLLDTASCGDRFDPYACWAAATQGNYLVSRTDARCRLALHLREGASLALLRDIAGLEIPGLYHGSMRWCSAEAKFAEDSAWRTLHELAYVALAEPGLAHPGDPVIALDPIRPPAGRVPRASKAEVVIGVIDGACGLANRQFRRREESGSWQTRLAAFWDQQGNADVPESRTYWIRPADAGYGRELQIHALNELLKSRFALCAVDDDEAEASEERAIYESLNLFPPLSTDWTHGTHVLSTAGGSSPRRFLREASLGEEEFPVPEVAVDAADLIYVQLPEAALRDTTGRWACALVLDGLRYIVARAGEDANIVVNLSLGSFAGPHDGSSMLERAIDALIEEVGERLTVVVAAGNAGRPRSDGDGTVRKCHATCVLQAAGRDGDGRTFHLDVTEADDTETFVELWLPPGTKASAVTVTLRPPGKEASLTARPGSIASRFSSSAIATAQLINATGTNGEGPRGSLPMVLVAIGATRESDGDRAPIGRWRIDVRNEGAESILLEAWIERRDIPGELSGERPQYGFGASPGIRRVRTNTLGTLANGARTIVVSAAEFVVGRVPRIAESSSVGPSAPEQGIEVRRALGPGPLIGAASELTADGFLSGSYKTLKGTSMSSAWVTRMVAAVIFSEGGRPPGGVRAWLLAESGQGKPSTRTRDPKPHTYLVPPVL